MSVLSKALRFVVVAGLVSGCSVSQAGDSRLDTKLGAVEGANGMSFSASLQENGLATQGNDVAEDLSKVRREELATSDQVGFSIALEQATHSTAFLIDNPVGAELKVTEANSPSRLIVDLVGANASKSQNIYLKDDPYVKSVRVGVHKGKARIVFDLTEAASSPEKVQNLIDSQGGLVKVVFAESPQYAAAHSSSVIGSLDAGGLKVAKADKSSDVLGGEKKPESGLVEDAERDIESLELAAKPPIPEAEPGDVVEDNLENDKAENETFQGVSENEKLAVNKESAPSSEPLTLSSVQFGKDSKYNESVIVGLSEQAAYELSQTAPTEYTLNIPGATLAGKNILPQIAPKGNSGIRSVRVVEEGGKVAVRMFIDAGVSLTAAPQGANVLVKASKPAPAQQEDARAQLQPEEGGDATDAAEGDESVDPDAVARVNPTGIVSDDGGKVYTGRLISLDLQDTDIDNALRIIAEVSNLNIIASDDVTGKVTLRLIDVPWDQALDVILKTNGLDQVTEGNVIRIAPVEKLKAEREARRDAIRALENLEKLQVKYIRVSYARVTELQEQVEAVLSERGTVTVDERTNQIIVKDIKRGQEEAEKLIAKLDLRTPQVLLETQIVEGQRSILRDLGFQWNFQYAQSPETGNATGLNFPNTVSIGGTATDKSGGTQAVDFPAVIAPGSGSAIGLLLDSADGSKSLFAKLSALETEGKVKVISRPQVATVNNKKAVISSVEKVRVRLPNSGTSVATGSGASAAGGGASAFEEIDVGIELNVTPQASPDYYVLLDIDASSSTFGEREVDNIPSTIDRQATSTILVKSGMTFSLGGVYRIKDRDAIQGVPWLKDIPFLGALFRRTLVDKGDEELIFFITPHIVEGSFDPGAMTTKG